MPSSYRDGRSGTRRARKAGRAREPIRRPVPTYARTASKTAPSPQAKMAITPSTSSPLADTERSRISADLRRVGIITLAMIAIIVVLSRVL